MSYRPAFRALSSPPSSSPRSSCAWRRLPGVAAALVVAGAVLSGLAGCATPAPATPLRTEGLFEDAAFAPPSQPIDPAAVLALDAPMKDYLRRAIPERSAPAVARDKLLQDLFTTGRLRLDYEASMTRNARQAFEARRGNCLSLVLLTAAMARELDLWVTFQSVDTDELWTRSGDMYFLSGHVNVVLGHVGPRLDARHDWDNQKLVDFLPARDQVGRRTREIAERTVLAMYMNNRAAESMENDRLDDAYWFAKEAIRLDPAFLSGYNTLAVVYLRHHDAARAERVLRLVAEVQPDNPRVVGNLAQAVREQGRVAEAQVLERRLAKLEPTPPFHWFVQGQLAMAKGDWAAARRAFEKELEREPDYHEFHFWLAQAELRLGDVDAARKHLALAMENSTRRTDHDLYAAKLDRLSTAMRVRAAAHRPL